MIDRTILLSLRPSLTIADSASAVEQFQNDCLRPILKFQNELLLAIFQHYLQQRKGTFYKLTPAAQLDYIRHSVQKDSKLRELLFGMIIAHFTMEEWTAYLKDEKAIRKRMVNLIVERLQSQVAAV